jgi:hypothetical protein
MPRRATPRGVLIFTILMLATLAGCAHPESWQRGVRDWVGRSADSLVRSWGMPSSSYTFGDGSRALRYATTEVMEHREHVYQANPYDPKAFGSYEWVTTGVSQLYCQANFHVNAEGTITSADYTGQYGACARLFSGRI